MDARGTPNCSDWKPYSGLVQVSWKKKERVRVFNTFSFELRNVWRDILLGVGKGDEGGVLVNEVGGRRGACSIRYSFVSLVLILKTCWIDSSAWL
jgi:hypothetical protein